MRSCCAGDAKALVAAATAAVRGGGGGRGKDDGNDEAPLLASAVFAARFPPDARALLGGGFRVPSKEFERALAVGAAETARRVSSAASSAAAAASDAAAVHRAASAAVAVALSQPLLTMLAHEQASAVVTRDSRLSIAVLEALASSLEAALLGKGPSSSVSQSAASAAPETAEAALASLGAVVGLLSPLSTSSPSSSPYSSSSSSSSSYDAEDVEKGRLAAFGAASRALVACLYASGAGGAGAGAGAGGAGGPEHARAAASCDPLEAQHQQQQQLAETAAAAGAGLVLLACCCCGGSSSHRDVAERFADGLFGRKAGKRGERPGGGGQRGLDFLDREVSKSGLSLAPSAPWSSLSQALASAPPAARASAARGVVGAAPSSVLLARPRGGEGEGAGGGGRSLIEGALREGVRLATSPSAGSPPGEEEEGGSGGRRRSATLGLPLLSAALRRAQREWESAAAAAAAAPVSSEPKAASLSETRQNGASEDSPPPWDAEGLAFVGSSSDDEEEEKEKEEEEAAAAGAGSCGMPLPPPPPPPRVPPALWRSVFAALWPFLQDAPPREAHAAVETLSVALDALAAASRVEGSGAAAASKGSSSSSINGSDGGDAADSSLSPPAVISIRDIAADVLSMEPWKMGRYAALALLLDRGGLDSESSPRDGGSPPPRSPSSWISSNAERLASEAVGAMRAGAASAPAGRALGALISRLGASGGGGAAAAGAARGLWAPALVAALGSGDPAWRAGVCAQALPAALRADPGCLPFLVRQARGGAGGPAALVALLSAGRRAGCLPSLLEVGGGESAGDGGGDGGAGGANRDLSSSRSVVPLETLVAAARSCDQSLRAGALALAADDGSTARLPGGPELAVGAAALGAALRAADDGARRRAGELLRRLLGRIRGGACTELAARASARARIEREGGREGEREEREGGGGASAQQQQQQQQQRQQRQQRRAAAEVERATADAEAGARLLRAAAFHREALRRAVDSLHPGAHYARRCVGARLLADVAEDWRAAEALARDQGHAPPPVGVAHMISDAPIVVAGSCSSSSSSPSSSSSSSSPLLSLRFFPRGFWSASTTCALLQCTADSWDRLRSAASDALAALPAGAPPRSPAAALPGLEGAPQVCALARWASGLARSPRAREADSGARLLSLLHGRYVLSQRWGVRFGRGWAPEVEEPAAAAEGGADDAGGAAAAALGPSLALLSSLCDRVSDDLSLGRDRPDAAARRGLAASSLRCVRCVSEGVPWPRAAGSGGGGGGGAPATAASPFSSASAAAQRMVSLACEALEHTRPLLEAPQVALAGAADVNDGVGGVDFGLEEDGEDAGEEIVDGEGAAAAAAGAAAAAAAAGAAAALSTAQASGSASASASGGFSLLRLSAAWRTAREACQLLEHVLLLPSAPLASPRAPPPLLPRPSFDAAAGAVSTALATCKHVGVLDSARRALAALVRVALRSPAGDASACQLPALWLEAWLGRATKAGQGRSDVVRRSAGLPYEVTALLEGAIAAGPGAPAGAAPGGGEKAAAAAEGAEGGSMALLPPARLVERAMEALLAAALPAAAAAAGERGAGGEGREEPDPWPRVHALNALRVLLDDGATSRAASPWLAGTLEAALASLGAGAWEVRNAAGLAAAQLVRRLAGAPPPPEEPDAPPRTGAPTLRELEGRHGARLAAVLARAVGEGAEGCSSAAAASRPLAAALALLSRLRPDAASGGSGGGPGSTRPRSPGPAPAGPSSFLPLPSSSALESLRDAVSRCARARDWGVRALAARALPPLVPVGGMLRAAAAAADEAASLPPLPLSANHRHGLLLQVRALAAAAAWPPPASGAPGEGGAGAPAGRGRDSQEGVAALAAAVRRGCLPAALAARRSSSSSASSSIPPCPIVAAAAIEAAHAACKAAAVLLTTEGGGGVDEEEGKSEEEEGEGEEEEEEEEEGARRAARREVEALSGELGRACREILSSPPAEGDARGGGSGEEPGWGLLQRAAAAALAGSPGRAEAWPGREDALLCVAGPRGDRRRDAGATAAALGALCASAAAAAAAAAARGKGEALLLPGAAECVSAALAARAGPDVETAAFELWALLPPAAAEGAAAGKLLPPLAAAAEAARGGARSVAARAAALRALGRAVSSSSPASRLLLLPALRRASRPLADERERAAAVGALEASGALSLGRLIGEAAENDDASGSAAAAEAWIVAVRLLQDEDEEVRCAMAEVAWREMSRWGSEDEAPWWSPSSSSFYLSSSCAGKGSDGGEEEEEETENETSTSRPPITAPDAPIMLRHAISMLASLAGGKRVVREALRRWMLSGSNDDDNGGGSEDDDGGNGRGTGGGKKSAAFRMYEAELDNVFEEPLLLSQCASAAVVAAASRAAAREAAALAEAAMPAGPPPPGSPSPCSSSSSSVLCWPQRETLHWARGAAEQLARVCRLLPEEGEAGGDGATAAGVALRPLERSAPGGPATAAAVFLPAAKAAAALVGAAAVVYQEEEEEEAEGGEAEEELLLLEEVRSLVEAAARSLLAAKGSPHSALLAAVAGAARAWRVGGGGGRGGASSAGEVVAGLAARAGGRADGALFLVV